ncbi:DEHA2E04994p [Debaryomyces hansenii CBS767]|uniref:non-specific serine/threonine protein kinase n=1 Tax=Debaryomyces hansenii (strain ATCC 36239 / CBS 767 / BCRC 21394 / JCM 1990 / NBRC 0083 / IGC 2968) TaxID=284592 RepID=B5RTV7_DEBHA|nr:DEHA2E04994p [Debaryomyces hansenii CBS767]CAR65769.1 DEHA2E04994p [Debaryomyces hansenii CBS767]|eukprot:XP_002770423.1 DEHA2E04994p [Debaryomyces hansenii CBS767]
MGIRIQSADELQVCEEVGRGGFGVVYRGVIKATNEEVAIKQIDLENEQTDLFEVNKEIMIISECRLSQITQYYGCFVNHYKLWVIMEYVNGGSLFELLKPGAVTDENVISIIAKEILIALEYLHDQGKIHRDLKSQNILLNQTGEVKLTDFGVSTQLSSNFSRRNTTVGTPYWMAPEVILNNNGGHSYKADLWSLGCCVYELFTGKPPLQNHFSPMKALRQISRCHYENNFAELIGLDDLEISGSFKDFLCSCFIIEPKERFSATKLLKHKFITNVSLSDNDKKKIVKKLITNKRRWDQENHVIQKQNYYVPTEIRNNQKKWNENELDEQKTIHFDFSSIQESASENPIIQYPPSPTASQKSSRESSLSPTSDSKETNQDPPLPKLNYQSLSKINTKQENLKKTIEPELRKILNKVFHKLDSKNSLTTQQYDLLVTFNDNMLNLMSFIQYSEPNNAPYNKLLICQYMKYFLKELLKLPAERQMENNPRFMLQKLIIPSNLNVKLNTLRTISDTTTMTTLNNKSFTQFDEIEFSLFETWIDKMNEKIS